MKNISAAIISFLLLTPSANAVDYLISLKGGWGEGNLDSQYTFDDTRFSEEGYSITYGAGLVFDNQFVAGLDLSMFRTDSFLGADDRMNFFEYKIHGGYRFILSDHCRFVPALGWSRWHFEIKEGAFEFEERLKYGEYRGNNIFAQLGFEFPINSLIAIASSFSYRSIDNGSIKMAQAGIIFEF